MSKASSEDKPLQLVCMFDCEECDTTFDWVFTCADNVYEIEDMTAVPTDEVTCPGCGDTRTRAWEGWSQHQDMAGD